MRDWRDFYELVGTASVVLIGLLFIAAAIAAGSLAQESRAAMRSLLTPTVAHLTAALIVCILVSVPTLTLSRLGAALLAVGVSGLLYAVSLWWSVSRGAGRGAVLDDRLWHVLAPALCFALLALAGTLLLLHRTAGIELLAGALVLLLLLAMRNAWDLMILVMLRPPAK
jgi:hypothetical protein